MKRFIALALVTLSLFAITLPALAEANIPAGTHAVLVKDYVYIRYGPSVTSEAHGNPDIKYRVGTQVLILQTTSASQGWYKVEIPNSSLEGYIRADMVGRQSASAGWQARYGNTLWQYNNRWMENFKTFQQDLNTYFTYNGGEDYYWFHLYPDGVYGPDTWEAVKQFQRNVGLYVDGMVGENTKEAMYMWLRDHGKLD